MNRKERIHLPIVLDALVSDSENAAKSILKDRTIEATTHLANTLSGMWEESTSTLAKPCPPPFPLACSKGCSWCCYIKVNASVVEVLRIAHHLRTSLSVEAFEQIRGRVIEADDKTRGVGRDERATMRLACPLLENGKCTVYSIRPLACAAWNSADDGICERYYHDPASGLAAPVYTVPIFASEAIGIGLAHGLHKLGLDCQYLELNAALRIALDRPNAAERWLKGLPVFLQAHDQETIDRINAMMAEHHESSRRDENPGK